MLSPGFGWRMRMSAGSPAPGIAALEVVLSGRVLALEWQGGGVLFRAARQTVMRVVQDQPPQPEPDDPGGVLAHLMARRPKGQGPCRLRLPSRPAVVEVADDAGFCVALRVPQSDVMASAAVCC